MVSVTTCLGLARYTCTVSMYSNGTDVVTAICHTGSHKVTINKQLHGRLTITVTRYSY